MVMTTEIDRPGCRLGIDDEKTAAGPEWFARTGREGNPQLWQQKEISHVDDQSSQYRV
jgi:hypothetical protein